MHDLIPTITAARGGYAYRSDFLEAGLDDRLIRLWMREGLLLRLRHGTYAPGPLLQDLSPERRHVLAAFSVADKLGPGVAVSHDSAALAHTGTSWGVDLHTVHVTRLDGRSSRREAGVVHHVGQVVPDDDLVEVEGRLVVAPARAVVESCSISSLESGLVTVSFALREGRCTREELEDRMARHERWPGMLTVRLAVAGAEPRCESVGEVRSLFMFTRTGVPRPEVQVAIVRDGRVAATSDFGWWPCRHVGEFDGLFKYGRLNPFSSERLGEVVVREKRREDLIREEPVGMSRWVWSELEDELYRQTGARIKRDLERSRRLYTRNATHLAL